MVVMVMVMMVLFGQHCTFPSAVSEGFLPLLSSWEVRVYSLHLLCSFLKLLPMAVCRGGCLVSSEWTRPNLAIDVHSWESVFLPLSVLATWENMNVQEHRCEGGGRKTSSSESSWEQYSLCPPSANSWWSHLSFLSFFSLSAILHFMF